jgi:hypothetical protein
MIGVTRILRGLTVTNLLGDAQLSKEREKLLRHKYVLRALEILSMPIKEQQIFNLEGTD